MVKGQHVWLIELVWYWHKWAIKYLHDCFLNNINVFSFVTGSIKNEIYLIFGFWSKSSAVWKWREDGINQQGMYFHKEIKTSIGDEAYLLWCKMNNGTGFHFHLKSERNKSPSKKKERKKENQLDRNPSLTPLLNSSLICSSTLTEPTVCYKHVYYKHI